MAIITSFLRDDPKEPDIWSVTHCFLVYLIVSICSWDKFPINGRMFKCKSLVQTERTFFKAELDEISVKIDTFPPIFGP